MAELSVPGYVTAAWTGAPYRPGPKRGADLQSIAEAGVRIADAEGLGALSMRKVALELGFTTMALYRYVQSKKELTDLVVDQAFGYPPPNADDVDTWREKAQWWGRAYRRALLAHPWVLQVPITAPPLLPHLIAWMEECLAAFDGQPMGQQQKLSSMLVIDVYVRGQTQLSSGFGSAAAASNYSTNLYAVVENTPYGRVRDAARSGALEDGDDDHGEFEFEFGLQTILDGIAARIAAPSS